MSLEYIDIGSNLSHVSFTRDLADVLARALAAGVTRQIVTGADVAGSRIAAGLVSAHPGTLWCTAGVHPHHAAQLDAGARAQLEDLLALPGVVAVGECGLDYYRNLAPPAAQRAAFAAQLEIAAAAGLPVFLHQRDAHADFVAMLAEHRPALVGGVAHCFTGGPSELEAYVALDLSIGVTGWVCDERRGASLRESVPLIPAGRLMIETDAPYLLPRDLPLRAASRRNEPAYLPHIAAAVASLRGQPTAELAALTTANAERFFGI